MLDKTSNNAKRLRTIADRLIKQAPLFRGFGAVAVGSQPDQSPRLNANCGPGGKIIFYSGIIDKLDLTDDEIAAIMGHEMAHALREHSREAMSKAYGIEMAKQGAGAAGLGSDTLALADAAVEYGMTLPNSRGNENEGRPDWFGVGGPRWLQP